VRRSPTWVEATAAAITVEATPPQITAAQLRGATANAPRHALANLKPEA